jgi:hypothetical protein
METEQKEKKKKPQITIEDLERILRCSDIWPQILNESNQLFTDKVNKSLSNNRK